MDAAGLIADWTSLGKQRRLGDHDVFVVDLAAEREAGAPPLLILHGFPTSAVDFHAVLGPLRAERRLVLLDFLGYGLSDKPDMPYSLFRQADLVEAAVASCSIEEVDLLTHDMGDSVGGEVLARSIEGSLGFKVRRRVITNGSIYLELAHLTDGQTLLLSLPDERMETAGFDAGSFAATLHALFGSASRADPAHLLAAAELVGDDGFALLPRIIRYIEERREHERRWTGAIEAHPSPLRIVWGDEDPVAVWAIAERLVQRRPDAELVRLEGIGHWPMMEDPERFAAAVLAGLR